MQRDVTDVTIPIYPAQAMEAAIHHLEIKTVLRRINLIDDRWPCRHDFGGVGNFRLAVLVLSNRPRGVPLSTSR